MPERYLLIPAAGVGSRLNIGYPKQYFPLVGELSMLEITVSRLMATELFESAVVVVSPEDQYVKDCHFDDRVKVIACGGATRAESVLNGLKKSGFTNEAWVFVHDAARPCVDKESLLRLIEAIDGDCDGALLVQPVTDTVKRVVNGLVVDTLDRRELMRAQTPQAFRCAQLTRALESVGSSVTDESSAMEAVGAKIKVVIGSPFNIKVTYPEDIDAARRYLSETDMKE